ncbi:hypothetical protein B0H11DRAFT_1904214 [Mycena galericulata]|nr:hypothetical protein B0H11DRAFT_1904214 [Mycena galericulata]
MASRSSDYGVRSTVRTCSRPIGPRGNKHATFRTRGDVVTKHLTVSKQLPRDCEAFAHSRQQLRYRSECCMNLEVVLESQMCTGRSDDGQNSHGTEVPAKLWHSTLRMSKTIHVAAQLQRIRKYCGDVIEASWLDDGGTRGCQWPMLGLLTKLATERKGEEMGGKEERARAHSAAVYGGDAGDTRRLDLEEFAATFGHRNSRPAFVGNKSEGQS